MREKEKIKIVAFGRCFFPAGAFCWSTRKQAEMAKKAGYEGMEFLPSWRFVYEMKRFGQLLAPESMVASGHRDWRFDRVMEAKAKGKPWWAYQLKNKEDWLFPFSNFCLESLRRFQRQYQVAISTAWFADTGNFSPVMLELWGKAQGIDYQGLMKWLKGDPQNRGLVLDTAKFTSWLKSNDLSSQKKQVTSKLLPYAFEVHYRFKKRGLDQAMEGGKDWGRLRDDSDENLSLILSQGFRGRVVVELGWPDVEQNVVNWRGSWEEFSKAHRAVIDFIHQIS